MYQDPCVEFIQQISNLKAELTVLANQWRTLGGPSPPPPPRIILKDCKNLAQNNTNHTHVT